ncbi:MAG: tRNA pseudouridine(55) synthase TruB [Sphaerospermopsis sp. SIO1G2]|nr:tRNA pseudouridine(55) synthase TruB [Sphaerospermopsis sp. SIO1G2]
MQTHTASSSTRLPRQKRPKHKINGWINLDKPYNMTSTQAVGAVKRILSPAKIGHAGTLDPLATGVLPLALGEATKTVSYMMDAQKTYHFTIRFGTQTDTDDAEGSPVRTSDVRPDDETIRAALPAFIGEISQVPPTYSAIKIQGERAYDLARDGQTVTLPPRIVHIARFTLLKRPDADHADCEVVCGKGTYIRSLARDLSHMLGTCGHISALRRIQVGNFTTDHAISLDDLEKYAIDSDHVSRETWLEPVERALDDIPAVLLDHSQAARLRHGNPCLVSPFGFDTASKDDVMHKAFHGSLFLGLVMRKGRRVTPVRLFNVT